jgi:sulfoxide reductase heme-binding subunit YedZ
VTLWIATQRCDNVSQRASVEPISLEGPTLQLIWPWQDRNRQFSALKASAFALMLVPAIRLIYQLDTGEFGFYPLSLGGLVYWSGVWATAILLLAIAVTPAITILRWPALIDVRRMIGVTALAYTIAHLFIYFALRMWNFDRIMIEMATRLTLITATLSTIGLIALGATSLDAAIRYMGAKGWQRLHNAVYVTTVLAILHALLSRGSFPEQYVMSAAFVWLMAWRVLNRYGRGADAKALAILGVSMSLFAAGLEAWCAWLKRGYELSWTLANNFNLDLGIAPAWQLIVPGLLIALAAAAVQAAPHVRARRLQAHTEPIPAVALDARAVDQTASATR